MLFYPISGMLAADEEGTRATKGGKRVDGTPVNWLPATTFPEYTGSLF